VIEVRPLDAGDHDWAVEALRIAWGSVGVARLGELIDASALPGLVAWDSDERVGLLAYAVRGDACEVVSISTTQPGSGAGRALMEAVAAEARTRRCTRLWLTTTDNNRRAQQFYERWGMTLARVHPDGVRVSRAVKPSIPDVAADGVPLVDEIEYELRLEAR
jgi:GNAT superfamily N-acetyltransferase